MDRSAVIATESRRFAEVLGETDPAAACPSCPEWRAADLLWHLTEVQHFWAGVLGRGARTDADVAEVEAAAPARPATTEQLLALREQGTVLLLEQLDRLPDEEPRWSWWEPDQTVGFTRRMQTYEATVHRVDAELTARVPVTPIPDEVAAGALDQCVDVMWGWQPEWAAYEQLAVVELAATDTGQTWLVEVGHWTGTGPESGRPFDCPRAVRAEAGAATDGAATALVAGPAQDLALWAWGRGGAVETSGQPQAVAAVDALIAQGIQ